VDSAQARADGFVYGTAPIVQVQMTGEALSSEALRLLGDSGAMEEMRRGLGEVRARLASDRDPMETAADLIRSAFEKELVHDR